MVVLLSITGYLTFLTKFRVQYLRKGNILENRSPLQKDFSLFLRIMTFCKGKKSFDETPNENKTFLFDLLDPCLMGFFQQAIKGFFVDKKSRTLDGGFKMPQESNFGREWML